MWIAIKSILLKPLLKLNEYPVFYHGKNFYLVGFGVFSAVTAFLSMSLFVAYIMSKNIHLHHPLILWLILGMLVIIISGKLFHIFIVGKKFFKTPFKYLKQTSFYNQGGQLGVLLFALFFAYWESINFWLILDALCFSSCAGLCIGRLGCYNYGCCHGKLTRSKFAVIYNNKESKVLRLHPELKNKPLIPMQLISALFDFLLFIVLIIIYLYEPRDGVLALVFITYYNAFRIITHQFRANDSDRHKTEDHQVFLIFSGIFTALGVTGLVIAAMFYEAFPHSVTTKLLSFKMYFTSLISDPIYLATLLTISLACLFVYGFHYRKLGQHL